MNLDFTKFISQVRSKQADRWMALQATHRTKMEAISVMTSEFSINFFLPTLLTIEYYKSFDDMDDDGLNKDGSDEDRE